MDAIAQLNSALAGRYEVEREIGAGGMATVYLARDVRHERRVALKLLKPELGAVLGVDRFLAEIKVTANLQHPNLLPLFDSGETDGLLFYVMPFVEGETLRQRIDREKQLPVDEAVRLAVAVAGALDYAHRRGVIHRDLKPENILLHDSQPLVADFGIALAVSNAGGNRITQTGVSLGTPQYMSPEQATGDRAIDARTDVYSLGAVLYEMLSGEPPHTGTTAQAIIARVLTERPRSLRAGRASIPEQVDLAVERALEKLPADRWTTSHEFSDALQGKVLLTVTRPARHEESHKRRWLGAAPWALAAVLGLGAAWGWATRRPAPQPLRVLRYPLNLPTGQRFANSGGIPVLFSPDGKAIVYSGRSATATQRYYYRRLDELTATSLPGTEQSYNATFSPDGEWIAFTSSRKNISKVSVHGNNAATIANHIDTQGLSWGRGDVLVIGTASGLFRVSANGGVPERLTSLDSARGESSHSMPLLLGDGKTVLFWITTRTAVTDAGRASYLGVVRLDDKKVQRLDGDAANPIALVNGTLFFGRSDGTIAAEPFDPSRTTSMSAAVPSLQSAMFKAEGGLAASMSTSGDLVYVHGSGDALMTLLDSQGKRIGGSAEPRSYSDPRFSPDGRRVAVTIDTPNRNDIWIYDVASGVLQRLTSRRLSLRPAWTHDGRRVAYMAANPDGVFEAWWAPSDGSGPEEPLFTRPANVYINSVAFSPDGRYAIIGTNTATTGRDFYLMELQGDRKPVPLLQSEFNEWMPAISPDGRWLAYVSDESGQPQVYVRPFPQGGARVQVSGGGGMQPRWTRDSRSLLYVGGDRLVKATLNAGAGMTLARQDTLFEPKLIRASVNAQFDIAANGTFVVARPASEDPEIIVVTDWPAELRARFGSGSRKP